MERRQKTGQRSNNIQKTINFINNHDITYNHDDNSVLFNKTNRVLQHTIGIKKIILGGEKRYGMEN